MALQKVKDSMRTTTALDSTKLSGAVPTAALSNVDLVEGTKGADIASAGTIVIGTDGGYFDITGTTGITAMTVAAGRVFTLQFDGVVTLTHSATLYLSGAANFTTEANDHMTFISVGGNNVRQIGTGLKDGGSPVAAGGKLLQVVGNTVVALSTGTTIIPGDDTIPQITEGNLILTQAMTASSTSNKVVVHAILNWEANVNQNKIITFHNTDFHSTNAFAAGNLHCAGSGVMYQNSLLWIGTAFTTSASSYTVRMGMSGAGTVTFNGVVGSRILGGACACSITIMEIEV